MQFKCTYSNTQFIYIKEMILIYYRYTYAKIAPRVIHIRGLQPHGEGDRDQRVTHRNIPNALLGSFGRHP